MGEAVCVRLVGNLGKSNSQAGQFSTQVKEVKLTAPDKLGHLLEKIEKQYSLSLKRDSILILVNGIEANALNDLDTDIYPGDSVVLVPMFHGGL